MPTVISCPNCRTKLGIPSQATPQARDSHTSWAWLFAVLGSAFVAGAGGFAGGWLIGSRGAAPAIQPLLVAPVLDVKAPVFGLAEPMNWQNLQDHLAAKGMKTVRCQGRTGMWFRIGDTPLPTHEFMALEAMVKEGGRSYFDSYGPAFRVTEHISTDAATRESARIADVSQRPSFAWNRFVFDGLPPTLQELKRVLQ